MISVSPDDALLTAFQRMRAADISQLPVLQDGKLVGLLDESDLLLHVAPIPSASASRWPRAMNRQLRTLAPTAGLHKLSHARRGLGRGRRRRRSLLRPDHALRPAELPAQDAHMSHRPRTPTARFRDPRDPRRPVPRPVDRRDHAADLPDLDLRAVQPRRAQGLRVLAQPEPDARGARALRRRPRGRRAATRSPRASPACRRCSSCSTPARTSSRATTCTAARSACSSACAGAARASTSLSST